MFTDKVISQTVTSIILITICIVIAVILGMLKSLYFLCSLCCFRYQRCSIYITSHRLVLPCHRWVTIVCFWTITGIRYRSFLNAVYWSRCLRMTHCSFISQRLAGICFVLIPLGNILLPNTLPSTRFYSNWFYDAVEN